MNCKHCNFEQGHSFECPEYVDITHPSVWSVEEPISMGVSQWMNHGDKYGYSKFWKGKILKEVLEMIERMHIQGQKEMSEIGSEFATPKVYRALGHNSVLALIKSKIEDMINKPKDDCKSTVEDTWDK